MGLFEGSFESSREYVRCMAQGVNPRSPEVSGVPDGPNKPNPSSGSFFMRCK